MNGSKVRILIAEWIPSLNKGELAILNGMLKTFDVLGDYEANVFSFQPFIDAARYPSGVGTVDIRSDLHLGDVLHDNSLLNSLKTALFGFIQHFLFIMLYILIGNNVLKVMKKRIWSLYFYSDLYVICHNGVGCAGGFLLTYSPVYITLVARVLKKPIVVYGNGTSGYKRKIWESLAGYVLKSAALVTVRDKYSYRYLKMLSGGSPRVILTGDPAILAPAADSSTADQILTNEKIPKDRLLVSVTVTRSLLLKFYPSVSEKNLRYDMAVRELAKSFDMIIDSLDGEILFLPHCIESHEGRDDRVVGEDIASVMTNHQNVHVFRKEYSTAELKALMGKSDLMIGARIHSVIGALSMGTPSCTLSYQSDVRSVGLVGSMLKQGKWIYYVEHHKNQELVNLVQRMASERENISSCLVPIVMSAKKGALLNGALLKKVLESQLPIL